MEMKEEKETGGSTYSEAKTSRSINGLGLYLECGWALTKTTIYDLETGEIVETTSYPTSHDDLALCLEIVLAKVPYMLLQEVQLVSLSPPLMLDMAKEGKAGRACLILIGYPDDLPLNTYGARAIYLAGGHDVRGNEVRPLDDKGVRKAASENHAAVDAFAVSSYFSIRNPEHEARACRIIEEETDKPVLSGHQLSMDLDAVKRAEMASMNALLMHPMRKLITSTKTALRRHAVKAPLMVIRGDGNLMGEEMASCRPVETVLDTDSGADIEKAAPSTVFHKEEVIIRRRPFDEYQVYTPIGRYLFNSIEAATKKARSTTLKLAAEHMIEAGAYDITLEEEEEDITTGDLGLVEDGRLVLERRLTVRASGLPHTDMNRPALKAAPGIGAGI
jgi:hypothetical protein